jgi:hypothetical protein
VSFGSCVRYGVLFFLSRTVAGVSVQMLSEGELVGSEES